MLFQLVLVRIGTQCAYPSNYHCTYSHGRVTLRPFPIFTISFALLTSMMCSTALATPFTRLSPIDGGTALPGGVTEVGGVVFHAEGLNGAVLTAQLPASSLFSGFFDTGVPVGFRGNPGTIGIQSGFTVGITNQLGGGFSEISVRITLDDGDTGIGNFDENANFLLLNGIDFGAASNFSNVDAEETTGDGLTQLDPADPGFEDDDLETGFFHFTDPTLLANLFNSILASEEVSFQLRDDVNAFDNRLDFTEGVDGGLIDVGQGPGITPGTPVPEPASIATWSLLGLIGLGCSWWRRKRSGRKSDSAA